MNTEEMERLKSMHIAPYIQLATVLIGKSRRSGGNMFRHQLDTMTILVDYSVIDSILLKAAIVHDVLEDIPDFNHNTLMSIDFEGHEVYELVREVTKNPVESKEEFLVRILESGSWKAKMLKAADRISNMISLGYVNDMEFVKRYTDETERYIYPIAEQVSGYMLNELRDLVASRRKHLSDLVWLSSQDHTADSTDFL